MLLGSAMLGAVAAGRYADVDAAMAAMSELGDIRTPDPAVAPWHSKRLGAFEKLQGIGREIGGASLRASQ